MVFILTIKDNAFGTKRDKIYSLNLCNIKIKKTELQLVIRFFYI